MQAAPVVNAGVAVQTCELPAAVVIVNTTLYAVPALNPVSVCVIATPGFVIVCEYATARVPASIASIKYVTVVPKRLVQEASTVVLV